MVYQVEIGEVVGSYECPSCGNDVDIKVNKKGGLSAICTAVIDPNAEGHGNRKYCWDRHTLSAYVVEKTIKNYLEEKALENVQKNQTEEIQPAGEDTIAPAGGEEPEPRMETQREDVPRQAPSRSIGAAFFAGVGEFLTGDAD